MPSPSAHAPSVLVVGRYGGAVDVLAAIVQTAATVGAPPPDVTTAACDRAGEHEVTAAISSRTWSLVIVTWSPSDPCLALVRGLHPLPPVVVITWHPSDERPALPPTFRWVPAGRIRIDLPRAVGGAGPPLGAPTL
jgi:hypothetical protein